MRRGTDPAGRGTKARLFNVKYSPNLGDGLLAECLEAALKEHGADQAGTYSVDLGGRTSYAAGSSGRGHLLRALQVTPPAIRRSGMRFMLSLLARNRWRPHYRLHLDDADAIVVGGGNLFTDMDLNFPVKISAALGLAAERGIPSAVYGVGVSAHWSNAGLDMMRRALAQARPSYVSVRDDPSKANFDRLFAAAAGREAMVVRDPGLMISRYTALSGNTRPGERVGLCVTSAIALNYHSDRRVGDRDLEAWYLALAERLVRDGRKLSVFTNGSPEDDQFFARIKGRFTAVTAGNCDFSLPSTPTELAQFISGLSFLVAHRMHALIAAFSFGVPIFALEWDRKVNAFMASVGLADRTSWTSEAGIGMIAAAVERDAGRVDERCGPVVQQAFADVGGLAAALARR